MMDCYQLIKNRSHSLGAGSASEATSIHESCPPLQIWHRCTYWPEGVRLIKEVRIHFDEAPVAICKVGYLLRRLCFDCLRLI